MKAFILSVLSFLFLLNFSTAAKLPHQGRVLISGVPFHGEGFFAFALISQTGEILWNHEGSVGEEPSGVISIPVEQGFYSIVLGDSAIEGIATLPDEIFELKPGVSLRIWFDDGTNGKEQLGKDQPLLVCTLCIKFAPTILVSIFGAISGGPKRGISSYWRTD